MAEEQQIGAVRLTARRRGVSPPVARRIWIGEQASLAEMHTPYRTGQCRALRA